MAKLTKKEEAFIDAYFDSKLNASEAFRRTYKVIPNMNVNNEAYRISSRPHVKEEIERRRAELSQKNKITRENLLEDLIRIKDLALDDRTYRKDSLKAIEQICKMLGFNEPDKMTVTVQEYRVAFDTEDNLLDEPEEDNE